jgi:hypothetical protein
MESPWPDELAAKAMAKSSLFCPLSIDLNEA